MNATEYNKVVNQYADRLFRFVLKSTHNHQDAEDIVQLTFEKLWRKRNDVKMESLKSWLFTVAHNKMVDNHRKRKPQVPIVHMQVQELHISQYDAKIEHIDLIQQSLKVLTEEQRRLVLLKDYEGYSYKEIANIMMLSESQVKVYLFRARKKIQAYVKNQPDSRARTLNKN